MRRWFVVETRVWEVQAPTEADAIATVEGEPDRVPVYHTTTAEPLTPPAAGERAGLRVLL